MNGASYVIRSLVAEGVDHVFMVPGGMNDPFMPAMTETQGLHTVVAAHEGGAAYMADGYARASGRLGVAFGIGGPGIFNMVTALAAARADRSAVLAISGEVPTDREGRGGFQDASGAALDDVSVLRPVTAQSVGVTSPKLLDSELRTVALTALRERSPVHFSVPLDVQRAELDASWVPLPEAAYRPMSLDSGALQAAFAVFDGSAGESAKKIVMLAGIGVGHAHGGAALAAAAERFAIPVATTLGAKGILPENHPLSLGVFGYGGSRWATEAVLDPAVEVLIVLGSALSQRDTLQWNRKMLPSRELIQVDADPSLIGRTWPATMPVTASPRLFLEHLAAVDGTVAEGLSRGMSTRRTFLAAIRDRGPRAYEEESTNSNADPMHPARMISAARAACPPGTVLAVDSGAHRAWCSQYWLSYGDGDYLSLANLAPMGGAIGLGIGAKLARPDRPLVVATGDGCMLMHGLELHTAARHRLQVVVLVFDNRSYGNIWYRASRLGPGPERLTDITGVDWPAFARSMGGDGIAVNHPDELQGALDAGLAFPGPFVIAARVDKRYPTPVAPWREAVAEWEDDH
jgi:acetolactate synthase-1/2/3 large subunit